MNTTKLCTLVLATVFAPALSAQFAGSNVGPITSNSTRTISFTASGVAGSVTDVTLDVTMSHTWVGDLTITLTAPNNASVDIIPAAFSDSSNLGSANGTVDEAYTWTDGGMDACSLLTITSNGSNWDLPAGSYSASSATLNITGGGTFTTSGSGCGPVSYDTLGLYLTVDNAPTIGQTTTVTCQVVPMPRDAAVLMLGSAPNQNVPLDSIGMPGCTLYVNNIFHNDPMMLGATDATISYPFPNDPASVGASITMQAAVLDMTTMINPFGLILSDLGSMTLGSGCNI